MKQKNNELWSSIGQGCAASSPSWIAIEAFIIKHLEEKSEGASFICPEGDTKHQLHTIGYIDDNNLVINKNTK